MISRPKSQMLVDHQDESICSHIGAWIRNSSPVPLATLALKVYDEPNCRGDYNSYSLRLRLNLMVTVHFQRLSTVTNRMSIEVVLKTSHALIELE